MSKIDQSLLQSAIDTYILQFGSFPEVASFAPGRVNLIGEHTDYNDGFVLPFALPFKTIIVGSVTNSKDSTILSCSSINDKSKPLQPVTFRIDSSLSKGEPFWANYVKGTVFQYMKDLPKGFAFNAVIISNVPIGSGLSSSASLEYVMRVILLLLWKVRQIVLL